MTATEHTYSSPPYTGPEGVLVPLPGSALGLLSAVGTGLGNPSMRRGFAQKGEYQKPP